jgi:hypothetical protein
MTDQEILAGPEETAEDSGTLGLNVYGNVGGNMETVLSYTATGQVTGALAWLTGNFTGTENMGIQIAQPWDNNGTLGLNIYGNVGGTLQPVLTSSDMAQGAGALAWLTGNFTGTGNDFTEIARLWDNNGTLGLIVYGMGNGTLETVFTNPNMSQGSSALAFLPGDFTGAGTTTQIAQLWDNNGSLEMIVYGNVGNDNLGTVSAFPMHQGSSALAFLTGNFIGSGYTQIAQTRDNNGTLQLLIYGNIGNGSLSTVFSNDISQIPNALAWVTGDFTGTGNTQILQPWMTVFG